MDNAIKYTPAGGVVTIRCGVRRNAMNPPHRVFLQVEDDGPGVPDVERGRVTQRFYRVPGTGEGTGLGLAIADEIARVHHAALTLGVKGRGWWWRWCSRPSRRLPEPEPPGRTRARRVPGVPKG